MRKYVKDCVGISKILYTIKICMRMAHKSQRIQLSNYGLQHPYNRLNMAEFEGIVGRHVQLSF